MSIATVHDGSRITLIGEAGSLELHVRQGTLSQAARGESWTEVAIAPEDRLGWTAEIDFVNAIRGGDHGTLTDFATGFRYMRSEEHTSELQSLRHLVCRLLLEKKKQTTEDN